MKCARRDGLGNAPAPAAPSGGAAGFSLVELLVSLALGLGVVAALLSAYLASGRSSRQAQAMAQITEDAGAAMQVLRQALAMAGYSRPLAVDGDGHFVKLLHTGLGAANQELVGCDGGTFVNLAVAIDALRCSAARAGAPDALALVFEADVSNSVLSSAGVPLDCLGNSLATIDPGSGYPVYYLAYSRFYVATSDASPRDALFCRGAGAAGGQALVENIANLQFTYGVAGPSDTQQVVKYVAAPPLVGPAAADWPLVRAVRVCVVVASADEVMDTPTPYYGCDLARETRMTPADRRLYRAFTTTVVLNNRRQAA
jgi:type IV pilus assembly protein PilW